MHCRKALPLGVLGFGLFSTLAGAQVTQPVPAPRALITEGDAVIGLGAMKDHKNAQISEQGMWIGQILTTFDDAARDEVLLRNGFVTLRDGASLFAMPGAQPTTLVAWTSYSVSETGNLAMALTTKVGASNSAGLYWNTLPVTVKSGTGTGAQPITGPGIGQRPANADSFWQVFSVMKIYRDRAGQDHLGQMGMIDTSI